MVWISASRLRVVALVGLVACVPATLDIPVEPRPDFGHLVGVELEPALSDDELEQLGLIAVLPPGCWDHSAAPLMLAWRGPERDAMPEQAWRHRCSNQPMLLAYTPDYSRPYYTFSIARSGHLFTRIQLESSWATAPTDSDLVGLRERLAATPGWSVVDEQRFAAWLGVDPHYASPGRSHAFPLDGNSWFLEENRNTDLQSGCPLSLIVELQRIEHYDGHGSETLLGPPLSLAGVLIEWDEVLRKRRPPLLLYESYGYHYGLHVIGNQLVDYPRCTVGEIAIAADWLTAYRRTLPPIEANASRTERVEWLFAAHAAVPEPPAAFPSLAAIMRRDRLTMMSLQAALAWKRADAREVFAAVGAWFEDPANLAQQPLMLHDFFADEDFGIADLDRELLEQVFPRLLEIDAAWWQAAATGQLSADDATRADRARRDAIILEHEDQLARRVRSTIARLCAAWRRAPPATDPAEPPACVD